MSRKSLVNLMDRGYIRITDAYSPIFEDDFSWYKDREMELAEKLKTLADINNKQAFIWELKKIYYCSESVETEELARYLGEIPNEVIKNLLLAVPEIKRDLFVTKHLKDGRMNWAEFIAEGIVQIVYTSNNFKMWNFSHDELDNFEGDKIPILELNRVSALFNKAKCNIYNFTYAEYQEFINKPLKIKILREQDKKKKPIIWWEEFKQEKYVLE